MKLTQLISPTLLCLSALASPLAGANCDHNQFSLQIKQIEKHTRWENAGPSIQCIECYGFKA